MSRGEPGKALLPPQAADYMPFDGAAQAAFPPWQSAYPAVIVAKNRNAGMDRVNAMWALSLRLPACRMFG
jgi:hypothetical protein